MRNATGIAFLPSSLFLRTSPLLANPPFNVSDWGLPAPQSEAARQAGDKRLRDDKRWKYGVPPVGNANFLQARLA